MPDLDAVQQIWRAASRNQFQNCILRNAASPVLPRSSEKNPLHGVACRLVGGPHTPTDGRLVKALALPSIWIAPCRMHRGFHPAGKALARLVGGDQQSLAMRGSGLVKFGLLRIRLIAGELVLVSLCLKIGNKLLNFFGFNLKIHRPSPQSTSAALAAS